MEGNYASLIEENKKFREFYEILLMWLQDKHDGRNLESFFNKHGYKSVAIYGFRELGMALVEELKNSDIEVKYAIDRDARTIHVDYKLVTPDDSLEPVDVVVVTAIHYFDSIKYAMKDKIHCPIVSLEEVIIGA